MIRQRAFLFIASFIFYSFVIPGVDAQTKSDNKPTVQTKTTATVVDSQSLERSFKESLAENSKLTTLVAELKKKLSDLDTNTKVLGNLNTILRNENETLHKNQIELEGATKKAAQLAAQLAELDKQNREQGAKVAEYTKILNETSAENKKLKEDMGGDRLGKEIEDLKRKIKNTEAEKDKALSELSKAVKQKEILIRDASMLHYNLGSIFFKNRDYKRATEEFKKSLELNPLLADAHYNLAVIFDDYLGDGVSAILHYKKYLELSPNSSDTDKVAERMLQAQLREKSKINSPLEK
jgi:tetratricopeptide (TPR) repeat protein